MKWVFSGLFTLFLLSIIGNVILGVIWAVVMAIVSIFETIFNRKK
jgi:hypothetical protein